MANKNGGKTAFLRVLSYVLVAAAASAATLMICGRQTSKLDELEAVIQEKFIGQVDKTALQDAAADAMITALGDRWSFYIPADQYEDFQKDKTNRYVGIGISVAKREDGAGFDIPRVESGGPAEKAGVLPGDILVEVQGQTVQDLSINELRSLIQGEEGTDISIAILRDGQTRTITMKRQSFEVDVATAQMIFGDVGLVTIANFHEHCAEESKAAAEKLLQQGAKSLIFDVRNNGGGYVTELVELLDYLLPEGDLFRSVDYRGKETVDTSDAACVDVPMAVMINGNSYSAAEFFAAALEEYDWATVVGTPTSGKGHFQYTLELKDGSAVNLSVGKYLTPDGVNLEEIGGLTPDVNVPVDEQTEARIYMGAIEPEEDPQIQAAAEALRGAE